jgi:glucose 1-dehydrogenase
MPILKDKVAVITGGTRGLGLAIAQAYAAQGAAVVIAARSQSGVDAATAYLAASGGQARGLAVDVSRLEQVEKLAALAVSSFGKIDIWVNNAGTAGPYGPTAYISPDAYYQVIQSNITGVYNGSRTALNYFLPQNSGKLINVLGAGWNGPVAFQNAYAPSKAWNRSFTLALAKENKDSRVGIYAFNPGMVLTDLLTQVDVIEGSEARLKIFPTIIRMIAKLPEIPAQKALWIASSATDGKTGLLINFFSPLQFLGGALREGLAKLLNRPLPQVDVKFTVIPKDERISHVG